MATQTTQDLVRRWLAWDKDPSTRVQVETLAANQNWAQLERDLRTRIQFGTAGLRGSMRPGFANINSLTVIQTSQGIASYLASSSPLPSSLRVVIGYDTRHQSPKFARLAANAFKHKGIETILFEQYVPTPFVAFGVRHFHANAGIMITASHNPAEDNGYKVYWSNGAQINAPLDQYIAASILDNQEPWEGGWDTTPDEDAPSITDVLLDAYVVRLKQVAEMLQPPSSASQISVPATSSSKMSVMYTPLHGVGSYYGGRAIKQLNGIALSVCVQQMMPDPDFPTVKFPNPEEDGALDLAFENADAAELSLVIANDPDADRFAAAQKISDGKWHRFTGDQMGVLLASYLLDRVECDRGATSLSKDAATACSERDSTPEAQGRGGAGGERSKNTAASLSADKLRKVAMLTTAVSSGMLPRMTLAYGVHFEETLTGFKWLGNRAHSLAPEYHVIFAYEEALGYMFPPISYDKDGIAAASTFLHAVEYWKSDKHAPGPMTPYEKLQSLYKTYGYHESINTYFISPHPSYTTDFFNAIRMCDQVEKMKVGFFKILRWRDVTSGVERPMAPHPDAFATTLPMDRNGQMLTFHLQVLREDGETDEILEDLVRVTLRASGTEPKVKLYLECCSKTERAAQWLAGEAFTSIIGSWILEYGVDMQPASRRVRSSSGVVHDI